MSASSFGALGHAAAGAGPSALGSIMEDFAQLDISDLSEGEDADSSSESDDKVERHFDQTRCLFCNHHSFSLDENISHMQKRHGLFIPNSGNLVVDVEVLLDYLHLIIFEYTECLYCGSIRNTPQAAQQHMIGRGHCRIDITNKDSEFRDFYEFDSTFEKTDVNSANDEGCILDAVDKKTRSLASGITISHRHAKAHKANRPSVQETNGNKGEADQLLEERACDDLQALTTSNAKNKNQKHLVATSKADSIFTKQLASLRSEDQRAIAHLPMPQQRALIAKSKKQQEKWNRERVAQEIKIQLKASS